MSRIDAPIIMCTKNRVKSVRTMKVRQDSKLVRTTRKQYLKLTTPTKVADFNYSKFITFLHAHGLTVASFSFSFHQQQQPSAVNSVQTCHCQRDQNNTSQLCHPMLPRAISAIQTCLTRPLPLVNDQFLP